MLSDEDLRIWKSKMAAGRMAYDLGFYTQATQHFRTALAIIENRHLPEDLMSRTLVNLAKALGSMGQFEEGESLLNKALDLDQKEHASIVEIIEDYHQLSLLYWRANKQEPANAAVQRAWDLLKSNLKDVPDELRAKLLKHRAVLSGLSGNYKDCERLINEAITFISSSSVLGKFSSIYGDSLMVKIMMLTELDRFDEAKELYPEAIKILEVTRGEAHVKNVQFFESLAHLARDKGLDSEAAYLEAELKRAKSKIKKKEAY